MFKRARQDEQPRRSRALTDREPPPAAADDHAPRQDRSSRLDPRDEHETLISAGSSFDGTYRTEESIRIRGRLKGEVVSQRSIVVEAQATVTATVIGLEVTVAGQVDGQIRCTGRVELTPSARVTGEITAGTLVMQEGAFFEGLLQMASRGGATSPVAVTTKRSAASSG